MYTEYKISRICSPALMRVWDVNNWNHYALLYLLKKELVPLISPPPLILSRPQSHSSSPQLGNIHQVYA